MADREDEGTAPQEEPARPPLDEDAVWAALVAGFGDEPEPGAAVSWPEAENVAQEQPPSDDKDHGPATVDPVLPEPSRSIVIHPVIQGPRDYELVDDDDAHFVPPEPPPLPDADATTTFAWIAVLGGPLLLLTFVLFQIDLTWWAIIAGVGGFLGGFATLVARMRTDEDDDDRPDGGAVV